MTADVAALAAWIDEQLVAAGDPERAVREAAYLKSDLRFYGTSVPAVRRIARAAHRSAAGMDHDALVALAAALWDEPAGDPVHERRTAAVELLAVATDRLDVDDAALLERLLRESLTWALVDGLSTSVVGPIAARDERYGPVLDRWSTDDDFWVRRAALLALLVPLRDGAGDVDRFLRYADAMLDEREFFIRKAIGWVLRDTAKRRPDLVFDWLLPRARRASGVTIREAVKHLSEEQRAAVLAAR